MSTHPLTSATYGLYGEQAQLADVLHCESIPVRSAPHNWELAAHRHPQLHQFLLLVAGGGRLEADDHRYRLDPPCLVSLPPGVIHAFQFQPGSDGWVLTLSDGLLDELLRPHPGLRALMARSWVSTGTQALHAAMAQIAQEFEGKAPGRTLALRGLLSWFLASAGRVAPQAEAPGATAAAQSLLTQFQRLLDQHFAQHWAVSDYARALGVSPTHLSRVTRQQTGLPASRLIDARVVLEARRELAFTPLPVSVIAEGLGFADPALFSRVFSRTVGCSPRTFRQRLAVR